MLTVEEQLAQLLVSTNALSNQVTGTINSMSAKVAQLEATNAALKAQIIDVDSRKPNLLESSHYALTRNAELTIGLDGIPNYWNVNGGANFGAGGSATYQIAETFRGLAGNTWSQLTANEKELAVLMGLSPAFRNDSSPSIYALPFNIVRITWSGMKELSNAVRGFTMWQLVCSPGYYTSGAFVKRISGLMGQGLFGNQNDHIVNKWAFVKTEGYNSYAAPSSNIHGYMNHCHPYFLSESGEYLMALPAVVSGVIRDSTEWGMYPYLPNPQQTLA